MARLDCCLDGCPESVEGCAVEGFYFLRLQCFCCCDVAVAPAAAAPFVAGWCHCLSREVPLGHPQRRSVYAVKCLDRRGGCRATVLGRTNVCPCVHAVHSRV